MTNKEVVVEFYEKVFNGWDLSYVDDHMLDTYKQHSAGVADGKEGFMKFMADFVTQKPHATIIKAIEDGDMVCVFFKVEFENGVIAKVFDMYRLENGKLAEHWDSVTRVDDLECAHPNGHF